MARLCVIGRTIQEELFGEGDPIGQRIYINKVALTVKGVLEDRGTSPMGGDFDNKVILPITTAMRRVMNVDYVGAIRIITQDPAQMTQQAKAIRQLIHDRHRINPSEEDDFRIITAEIIARLARGTSGTMSMLLIALAALSLIIGGVVLMNILLISVAERTQEIGLRRAVGATRRDIFLQFLTESLAVTVLGMVLGSVTGLGVSVALPQLTPIVAILSWEPFILALAFALLVGTFFGVQPARRAARLRPVEALR
jgi:putative ABC transport system permease protein